MSEIHTYAEILPPGPKATWIPVNRPIFPDTLIELGQPPSEGNPERSVHPFRGSSDVLLAVLGNRGMTAATYKIPPVFERPRGLPESLSNFVSSCYAACHEIREVVDMQGWLLSGEVEGVTRYYDELVRRDLWPESWLEITIPEMRRLAKLMGGPDRVRLVYWFTTPREGGAV